MNALELQNVTKEYPGFSLTDISFSLPSGYIMGLIGENGAGKTTTLKAILGLIHSQGSVQVLGRGREDITAAKEQVGVVLEDATFPDPLNGRDVARILRGVYKTWDREKFMGLLHQFDLDPKKKVKDYSRGMKMKLSLAVALSHDSRLLLLDEPTSGLDPVVREEVLDMLLQFIQEPDRSVLFSSHILSDLERVCDYVTFLHQGKLVLLHAQGSPGGDLRHLPLRPGGTFPPAPPGHCGPKGKPIRLRGPSAAQPGARPDPGAGRDRGDHGVVDQGGAIIYVGSFA